MSDRKILVVGTTADYVEILRKAAPGKCLFVTAHTIRKQAFEPTPTEGEEILCDTDPKAHSIVTLQIKRHLRNFNISLDGIACFDCESMDLTARIALALGLDYPAPESILNCRDKSRTKEVWRANGVPCPRFQSVSNEDDVRDFFKELESPCVLKPVDGSGSERVFKCRTEDECVKAFAAIRENREAQRVIMEEFVDGTEYSCDFIVDKESVRLIRMTRKIHAPGSVFGTIMAYEMIDFLSENVSRDYFMGILGKAARSLGIERSLCMLDFIVSPDGDISLLEIAPRPGGDCLPWLIQRSMGLDILRMTLSAAEPGHFDFKKPPMVSPCVGLRIHAKQTGRLKNIDTTRVAQDPRVTDVYLKYRMGHQITLPPQDYDSWNLGHIIFKPAGLVSRFDQCRELLSLVKIDIDHERPRS
ncbi:MAG: ATP-grasp domain-containing protein [Desulfobacteraceae bacterium]|jgi:biotin carboxylase